MSGVVNCGMQKFRFVLAALCVTPLLLIGATKSSATQSSMTAHESCTWRAVADGINPSDNGRVVTVLKVGCEGLWSYLWAEVASETQIVEVTVVLKWRPDLNRWLPTDRAVTCVEGLLPETIYRQGCFSN